MKKEFEDYLTSIGMGEVLRQRVTDVVEAVSAISPEEIADIFVSEYVDQDASRKYEKIYFFTASLLIEVRNFVSGDLEIEFDLIKDSVINFAYTRKEYDFRKASDSSRLNFRYSTGPLSAELKASGENCDHLLRVVRECMIPNLAQSASPAGLASE